MNPSRLYAALGLAFVFLFLLTGCMSYAGSRGAILKVGTPANEAAAVVQDAEARGEIQPQSSSNLFGTLLAWGATLLGVGVPAGAVAYGAAKRKASQMLTEFDAQPFTPSDVRSMKAAEIAAASPNPGLLPVA